MELLRALGAFAEPPGPHLARIASALGLPGPPADADHAAALVSELPPYASRYLGPDGRTGGEARDRIAGFWRAMGETPPDEPDHLTVMLSLQARLGELEAEADDELSPTYCSLRRAHLSEHLVSWLPAYLSALEDLRVPLYTSWAGLLRNVLEAEARLLGPLSVLSAHLAAAPALADPRREGAEAFVSSLLSPARSGLVLTRAALGRAVRDLDASAGHDRRTMLRTLLDARPADALAWLVGEASVWLDRHRAQSAAFGVSTAYWTARTQASKALLVELSTG